MLTFMDPPSMLRIEIQEFIRSSESLMSSTHFPSDAPLSDEERTVVAHYAGELKAYLLGPLIP